jgi:aminoglycoside 3-N-acetyltransferase
MHDVAVRDTAAVVVDAVRRHLGSNGTLVVPAPNWDYGARRQPFDVASTPVSKMLGVVSAHVNKQPGRRRSANPIFSVAAIGARAANICDGYSTNAFGHESPWQRMFDLDADMLCLGSDFEFLTFIRYMEARFGVPYLYNKYFDVPVLDNGKPINTPVIAPLRYADLPIRYAPQRFTERCRAAGVLREVRIGDGTARALRMRLCFEVGMAALREDLHFFLDRPPAYASDRVPRL